MTVIVTLCPWCGDTHSPDRICQRAQRGTTRRSFCFLFGAGIAATYLPIVEIYRRPVPHLSVLCDQHTTIIETLYSPTIATFVTDRPLELGQTIDLNITLDGEERTMFRGIVMSKETRMGGVSRITATGPTAPLHQLLQYDKEVLPATVRTTFRSLTHAEGD